MPDSIVTVMTDKQACDRCGSCCMQGGPALHRQDLDLVRSGVLRCEHLVTVRKGELAYQPLAESATQVIREFLKLQGRSGSWTCLFYDDVAKACTIYEQRPVACGLLDCTAPEALLAITGKELLTRFDCIGDDDPLLALVRRYEDGCPCPDMAEVEIGLQSAAGRLSLLEELTRQVNIDLDFRAQAAGVRNLSVAEEVFYFGRPLFQLLMPLGIQVRESSVGLEIFMHQG